MGSQIENLHINGFRALKKLEINDITDVNLIVGKNNTGKTTVLEALRLLLSGGVEAQLFELLTDRDEFSVRSQIRELKRVADLGAQLSYEGLFSGRPVLTSGTEFSISAKKNFLRVIFTWLRRETSTQDASLRYLRTDDAGDPESVPGFVIDSDRGMVLIPIDRLDNSWKRRRIYPIQTDMQSRNAVYLPSSGMNAQEIGEVWDSIALTDEEEQIVKSLHIIAPKLEKLVMVQSPRSRSERMLMAKLKDFSFPVPFKSLGEGTNHLLSIALSIIKARNGVLLIDEVENGIHYSVQDKLWALIFKQAENLDVQVFATTHSWDCVTALHHAGKQGHDADSALFRLEERPSGIGVVRFTSDELAIAEDAKIEVR